MRRPVLIVNEFGFTHQTKGMEMKTAVKIFAGICAAFVVIVIGIAMVAVGSSANKPSGPGTPPGIGSPAVAPVAEPAPPAGPVTTIGDGTWLVGTDMAPGDYKSPGSSFCYHARLRTGNGALGDIIDNNAGVGPQRFTANVGETVEVSGGCVFTLQ